MTEIRRILIVTKYRFIGDTLLSIPAIRAASQLWPDAKISLLTGQKALEILRNCPYVHDPIEFDPYRAADKGIGRFLSVASQLRSRRFDLALVLNRSFHSALISTMGGARLRAGWANFASRDFMLSYSCPYGVDDNEVDSYLDIVRCAYSGLSGTHAPDDFDHRLELWLTEDERHDIPEALRGGARLVAVQPGASHENKRWAAENFAALADTVVADDPSRKLVVIGGPDEKGVSAEMLSLCASQTRERAVDLTGQLTLRSTAAVLANCSAFLANDTGIRHVAVAVDVPTIGVFGPTSAKKWGNEAPPRHTVIASVSGEMRDVPFEPVRSALLRSLSEMASAR